MDEKVSCFISNKPDVARDTFVRVNPGDRLVVPKWASYMCLATW